MAELRRHVAQEPGDERAVLAIGATTFPSPGPTRAVSAARGAAGWGSRGTAGAAAPGPTPPRAGMRRWPDGWTRPRTGPATRPAGPAATSPRASSPARAGGSPPTCSNGAEGLPHGWVVGDDEFGRPAPFQARPRGRGERYVLDVPSDTVVRDLECVPPPSRRPGHGRPRAVPFRRVDAWAAAQPAGRWTRPTIRPGGRGPLRVVAMAVRVRTRPEHRLGPGERLVVMRTVGAEPEAHYAPSAAAVDVPLGELIRARSARRPIEEVFEADKQGAGLARDEVRGWVGWHHHVTPSLLAPWLLCRERRRVVGKTPAIAASQAREVFASLLRVPGPGPERIAGEVTRVLRREEAARIYHWHEAAGGSQPRRHRPDTS